MDKFAFQEFDAERAMYLPLGMASPLWLAFSGAAAAGMAFYWMNRWRAATNLEAMMTFQAQAAESVAQTAEAAMDVVEAAPDPAQALAIAMTPEPTPEQAFGADEAVEAAEAVADDLTRIAGIGPKLAASLAERGVTRFGQIAAWTADEIADLERSMKLMGRIERDAWVAQARRFAAGA